MPLRPKVPAASFISKPQRELGMFGGWASIASSRGASARISRKIDAANR
jgi:hypothetical protein